MAYDIGPKIGIDGESEFRKSIRQVSENIKTLGSEMKVVTTAFADNADSMEVLTRKNELLRKQADAVYEKMKLQAEMAGRAAGQYGVASVEAQQWQRALNESQAELNKLNNEIKANERSMDALGNETETVEKNLDDAGKAGLSFGDVLKANVLGDAITSGIRALGSAVADMARAFVDFAKTGVETASNLEEVQNVVDTTFGDEGADTINAWAKAAAGAFGMSELSAKQFTGTMGAMLKSMGLSEDAVLEMSTDIAGLAGDMASFYNLDPEEAFAKLRSGISGETEPLKQLGINMSVANLEAYALSQGITKAYKDMTQAEQATLRYNYLMQATADAQGDFARTSNSYANQQKVLQLNMENLGASIGTKVLPYLTGFSSELNGLLSGETDIQTFVSNLSGMVMQAAEGIITNLPVMMEAGGQIFTSLFQGLQDLFPTIVDVAGELIGTLLDGIITGLPDVLQGGTDMLITLVDGITEGIPDMIERLPEIITSLIVFLSENLPKLVEAGGRLLGGIAEGLVKAIPQLIKRLPDLILAISNGITNLLWSIMDIGVQIVQGIWRGIQSMWGWIKEKVGGFFSGIVDSVKDLLGIKSPSRVFASIGGYMAEGLGVGFGNEMKDVKRQIDSSMAGLIPETSARVSVAAVGGNSAGYGGAGSIAGDLRQALAGMAINMNGRRVGVLTTVEQNNATRGRGVPVTLT